MSNNAIDFVKNNIYSSEMITMNTITKLSSTLTPPVLRVKNGKFSDFSS